jgi:PAS domain S-box-containing protein
MTAHPKPSGPNLQSSVELLQTSVYLGVITANLERVVDANDAFLSMIGYTRDELESGVIDWRAMTPPDSLAKDEIALHQLREYGASVPFEKDYILRDGSRLPMLMGAIRLNREPLEWMCYVVNLTDRKRDMILRISRKCFDLYRRNWTRRIGRRHGPISAGHLTPYAGWNSRFELFLRIRSVTFGVCVHRKRIAT